MQCLQCHITWVIFIFYWTVRQSLDNCYNLTLFSNLRFLLEARVYLSIHSSEMPLFSYSFDSEFREQKNSEDISVCETWMLGFFYYKTTYFWIFSIQYFPYASLMLPSYMCPAAHIPKYWYIFFCIVSYYTCWSSDSSVYIGILLSFYLCNL